MRPILLVDWPESVATEVARLESDPDIEVRDVAYSGNGQYIIHYSPDTHSDISLVKWVTVENETRRKNKPGKQTFFSWLWWAIHNVVAHPLLAFSFSAEWAVRLHDWTAECARSCEA